MRLDIFTIMFLMGTVCLLAAIGFGIGWWRNRSERVLGYAASTFGLGGVSTFLIAGRGHVSDLMSIDFANAALLVALALGWNSFRVMNGRRFLVLPLILPCVTWLMLCQVPAFYTDTAIRTALASGLIALLSFGYCLEFWQATRIKPAIRLLLLFSAGGNVAVFAMRALYNLLTQRPHTIFDDNIWMALTLFVPLIFISALALGGLWLWQVRAVGLLLHEVEVDPLTGVLNRRAFERGAAEILEHIRIKREPLALLLIDMDFFKSVNDRFGHLAGDHVLRVFASTVSGELRKSDLFARYGGEEFVALLRGADLDDALQVAEKLRAQVADLAIVWQGSSIRVTVSIGVSATQSPSTTLFDLLDRADRGLYGAKGEGRNRVVIAMPG